MNINRTLNCRKAKRVTPDGLIEINPEDVKAGMIIRMYEPDGTPISYMGQYDFYVETDAVVDVYGVVGFQFKTSIDQM